MERDPECADLDSRIADPYTPRLPMPEVPDRRTPPGFRLVPRAVRRELLDALAESRAVALLGPRQAGKTTLVRDLLGPEFDARFLTLDDAATRTAAATDPSGFIADLVTPVIIDEIQRAPDLMLAIKERLDRIPEPGQFLITGSANLLTLRTIRDALPGRVLYTNLWPLSQSEIVGSTTNLVDWLFERRELPRVVGTRRPQLAAVVAAGGFPGICEKVSRSRQRYFEAYVDSVVGRDVPDVAHLRDPTTVGRLLRLLAGRSASLLSRESVARDLGVDRKTVDHHLRILQDLFLVRIHAAWQTNLSQRMIKTPKAYITDTGMLTALIGADQTRLPADPAIGGPVFETFVVMELVKLSSWSDSAPRILHFRDRDGREIDAILERPDGSIVAVDVKSSASIATSDLRALAYLRDRLGDRFVRGVVMYAGREPLPLGDRLAALPMSALWAST
jgi:predicted AAA+ superfamily ATPase